MTTTEEILQIHRTYLAAHDAGNLAVMAPLTHPDYSYFHVNAGLKGEAGAPGVLEAIYQSGYKAQLSVHHSEAQVYGDAAVVTCYLAGQFTWAGGNGSVTGVWRYTGMWVKVAGQWQIVHAHASPLAPHHSAA
ncbi:MAG: nuclear transport factor 2 family protein [Caldilinea sp. CFX5]|nr:nuclear transport factor 2 family protein [Caldilinea sp. CFX5]